MMAANNVIFMRVFFVILSNVFFVSVYCQNISYKIYEDSIISYTASNYNIAKKKLIYFEKSLIFDPIYKLSFLEEAIKNNDVSFFKKEIIDLIKNYGYYYSYSDTMGEALTISINWEIRKNKLIQEWLIKTSKKVYPKWVKNHLHTISNINKLENLRIADQQIRKISFPLISGMEKLTEDTSLLQSLYSLYDSIKNIVDLDNIIKLQTICINNGGLPTNYDSGISASKIVGLIIFHNLKEGDNLKQTWERIYPYVEKAYIDGKISSNLLYDYDYYLNIHHGYQYYGFLDNVPVLDADTFENRKIKLGLK